MESLLGFIHKSRRCGVGNGGGCDAWGRLCGCVGLGMQRGLSGRLRQAEGRNGGRHRGKGMVRRNESECGD